MELWVRSQNKQSLLKANAIIINSFEDLIAIHGYIDSDTHLWLGTYKTKERALEVLDEIQKFIERDCKEYKSNGDYYTSKYEYSVFQMPQE
jgi:hypothetical protein